MQPILKRKMLQLSVGLWALLVLLTGCSSNRGSTAAPAGAGASAGDQEPIVFGVLVSETGPASWLGDPEIKGAKIAVDELNAAGGLLGRPVKLEIYNDESTPEKAVVGARKLIEQDKVTAIIGTSLVATSKAVAPLVKDKGPVVYSLSGGYEPENRFMFAGSVHTKYMQQTIMDWFKANGLKKVALLATTDATGQVATDAIKQTAPAAGVEVVALERMNTSDVDVTPQLTRIRSGQPDAVIAWLTGKPAGVVVKNFSQLGMDIPLFVSHGNLSYTFVDGIKGFQPKTLLLPSTKDVVWEDLPESDPQRSRNENFHKKYYDLYKKYADYGPPVAYDAVMVVAEGIRKANSTDPEKVRSAIENLQNYTGLVGVYRFSADDHRGTGRKDTILAQVKDGKFKLFWR